MCYCSIGVIFFIAVHFLIHSCFHFISVYISVLANTFFDFTFSQSSLNVHVFNVFLKYKYLIYCLQFKNRIVVSLAAIYLVIKVCTYWKYFCMNNFYFISIKINICVTFLFIWWYLKHFMIDDLYKYNLIYLLKKMKIQYGKKMKTCRIYHDENFKSLLK